MQKPNNYENTQASGEFVPIELGGHIMVIKQVEEMKSKTGRDMLKVSFDFADTDDQAKYFEKVFRDDIRPEKKWPNAGTTYILTEDIDGNCSKQFKTFTTSVEKSNPGFQVQWGDSFCQGFKNKLVGGVFGIVEEEYNDKRSKRHKLRWFRSVEGVKNAEIPDAKLLPAQNSQLPGQPVGDGFMTIPDGLDEELPFN